MGPKLSSPLKLEGYIAEVLLRDLVGHDRSPAAFLVYFSLYALTYAAGHRSVKLSLKQVAERTGLSKSAVQAALRILSRRQLIRGVHATRTAVPEYFVQRPWAR
jgi:DNA-binding MarR family transcriptional regulator